MEINEAGELISSGKPGSQEDESRKVVEYVEADAVAELVKAAEEAHNSLLALLGVYHPDNLTMQDMYRSCKKKSKRLGDALNKLEQSRSEY